jgi:hypothetical protein
MHCWDSHLHCSQGGGGFEPRKQHNWGSSHTPAPSEQQVPSKVSLRRGVDAV